MRLISFVFILSLFFACPSFGQLANSDKDDLIAAVAGMKTPQTFSTAGHAKSDGLTLTIKYPSGWLAAEGERPHVVQKFTSDNGKGFETCMLIVKSAPQNLEGQLSSITEADYPAFLPSGSFLISGGRTKIDNIDAINLKFSQKNENAGIGLMTFNSMYLAFFENKGVTLHCAIAGSLMDDPKGNERFNLYSDKLFPIIANSIVVQDQWNKKTILADTEVAPKDSSNFDLIADLAVEKKFGPAFFVLAISFLFTWIIGLLPPLIIRFVILKRRLGKKPALVTVGVLLVLNIIIFTLLAEASGAKGPQPHTALWLIAIASYFILGPKKFSHKKLKENRETEIS